MKKSKYRYSREYVSGQFSKDYFHKTLLKSEERKKSFLFQRKGITNETIEKFSLGYSPDTWDAFTKEALGK
jgi:DNA primase